MLFFVYLRAKIELTPVIMGLMTITVIYGICYGVAWGVMSVASRFLGFEGLTNQELLKFTGISYIPVCCLMGAYIYFFGK